MLSVNVGLPVDLPAVRSAVPTAIDKRPVTGEVAVRASGLDGDDVGDKRFHGGPDQAVYAFAREDLDLWGQRLGGHLASGTMFGENLTTVGIDVNEALLGERWRVGTALLEVCMVRIPCRVFQSWLALAGHDTSGWIKGFTAEARPGAYLRVIEQGTVWAGTQILVEDRPSHGVTASTMFRALTTEPERLPELLRVEALPDRVRRRALRWTGGFGHRSGPGESRKLASATGR